MPSFAIFIPKLAAFDGDKDNLFIFLEILDKTSINSVCALEWSLSDAIAFDYYLNNIELFYDYKIA